MGILLVHRGLTDKQSMNSVSSKVLAAWGQRQEVAMDIVMLCFDAANLIHAAWCH